MSVCVHACMQTWVPALPGDITLRARLVDRVRPTVPLSYSTGCVKYDDEFPGWMQFWPRQPGNALPGPVEYFI